MFSKYVTLLAFAASAIAGVIEQGVYRITNVASQSTARSYQPFSPVFVSSTKENPGPFELWVVKDAEDDCYTLENLGLRTFAADNAGGLVETSPKATIFCIESAGNDEYVIKLPGENSVWTVAPPVVPNGVIELLPARGRPTQRWVFTRARQVQDDYEYDERWELLQRIGRFLGRI